MDIWYLIIIITAENQLINPIIAHFWPVPSQQMGISLRMTGRGPAVPGLAATRILTQSSSSSSSSSRSTVSLSTLPCLAGGLLLLLRAARLCLLQPPSSRFLGLSNRELSRRPNFLDLVESH